MPELVIAAFFFKDFRNMSHTHAIVNFNDVLLKVGKKFMT
jgi:hypothetical protein